MIQKARKEEPQSEKQQPRAPGLARAGDWLEEAFEQRERKSGLLWNVAHGPGREKQVFCSGSASGLEKSASACLCFGFLCWPRSLL